MFAESFLEPFAFASKSGLAVLRHGESCLYVGNDVRTGSSQEITARLLQALHFLLRRETVVDPFRGEDHERLHV